MNVLLIQPPDAQPAVEAIDSSGGLAQGIMPPWDLMCVQTFLQKHTRHISRFIDCRLMHDLERELVSQIETLAPPRILVVNCPTLSLGQAAAVLDMAKRHFPAMRTVLCGAYPSTFPDQVADIPRVDFALAGDPEPILRNLLDYIDVEQRLKRVPGLILRNQRDAKPYWLPRLHSLSMPDWDGVYWGDYTTGGGTMVCRAEIRLSRGHSRTNADRAFDGLSEPLRLWPMERLAKQMLKCVHTEVNEAVLSDPPGVWTHDRLMEWATLLAHQRNAQPWSVRVLPMEFSEDLIEQLKQARCRRVHVVFPTCDKVLFKRYGLPADLRGFFKTVQSMASGSVQLCAHIWVGGPEETRGETERATAMLRKLGHNPYIIEPFPFTLDSPLYQAVREAEIPLPGLTEWIQWSRDPWIKERPVALWGGREQVRPMEQEIRRIHWLLNRTPSRAFTKLLRTLRSRNWIELLEDKAIGWLHRRRSAEL